MKPCSQCDRVVPRLEIFAGGECLECHLDIVAIEQQGVPDLITLNA